MFVGCNLDFGCVLVRSIKIDFFDFEWLVSGVIELEDFDVCRGGGSEEFIIFVDGGG